MGAWSKCKHPGADHDRSDRSKNRGVDGETGKADEERNRLLQRRPLVPMTDPPYKREIDGEDETEYAAATEEEDVKIIRKVGMKSEAEEKPIEPRRCEVPVD